MVAPEALLAMLIIAFFLKDSLLMLRQNEAVLVRGFRGRWRAGFGEKHWRWAGREPYFANPLRPHEPIVRLNWQLAPNQEAHSQPVLRKVDVPPEVLLLGVFAWTNWLALLLLICTLTHTISVISTVPVVALLYASICVSLMATWLWRKPLGLDTKAFSVLAFECIACAPYAVNLVRRVATHLRIDEDFTCAARRLLSDKALLAANRECLARVDEQIEIEAAEGAAMTPLQRGRARFIPEHSDGHR